MLRGLCFALSLVATSTLCGGQGIQWAKGATHFGYECPQAISDCTLISVASPDAKSIARVSVAKYVPVVEIITADKRYPLKFLSDKEVPFVDMEILWSPDSSAVSFAANDSAISNFSHIFTLTPTGPREVDLSPVMMNMAKEYPPCVGYRDPCVISRTGKDYNYLTVAWSAPHAVVVMAEVPPSSLYGRNMAQVNGYEVDAATGEIIRVLDSVAFKRKWQGAIGWKFRIPDKP